MAQYNWLNCPPAIRNQIGPFTAGIVQTLGANLTGVYLHGSLAMGCFNPARSDLDLLVITRQAMTPDTLRTAARLTLRYSGNPRPFELSFLRESYLRPWHYPTPYGFHYGEDVDWRAAITHDLQHDTWTWSGWGREGVLTDSDLAAHVTVTRARGICLAGGPVADVFPPVPRTDYVDSIMKDFDFARCNLVGNPVYAVLNFCRIDSYLRAGRIDSKDEAGLWALDHLPAAYHPLIRAALDTYRHDTPPPFDPAALHAFADYVHAQSQPYIS